MVIPIRRIFKISLDKILDLKRNISVELEDGVIYKNVNYKKIILMRYILNFIEKYPVKITSDIWIEKHLVNTHFSNKTYLSMYSIILKIIVTECIAREGHNRIMGPYFTDLYETIDLMNNNLSNYVGSYMATLDIFTLLEIQFNQKLINSIITARIDPSPKSIEHTYETFDTIIREERYSHTSIALLYLSKTASEGQIKQMFASRGYVTEMNNKIFRTPMTNSFLLGFRNVYDAVIESRSAAKALILSGKSIQDTEYTSRELAISSMVVEGIHHGDCGRPVYVDFYLKDNEYDDKGNLVSSTNLPELSGKHYLDPITGKEKILSSKDTHLLGGFIKLRSALYCGLSDKKKICSACIGTVADTIFERDNLGNLISTEVSRGAAQGLLSAKHLLITAISAKIKLNLLTKKYFMIRGDEFLLFKANILNKKIKEVYLKVRQDQVWGLDTLNRVSDVFAINVNKISRISDITLVIKGSTSIEEIELPINNNSTFAHFTLEALAFIREHGYVTPDEDHFLININKFDNKKPIFKYDKVEFNLALLNKEFKSMLKTRKFVYVDGVVRSEFTPDVLVQNVFDLLNSKLNINIALIEILIYTFTVKDLNNRNYDLGRGAVSHDVVGFKGAIDYRSIGASYDWDDLQNKILDPCLYEQDNKPSSPMDVFIKPHEVVKFGE